jgi:hypothetical protein
MSTEITTKWCPLTEQSDETRLIGWHGRSGRVVESIHTRMTWDCGEVLNQPQGTLSVWVLPLETLNTQVPPGHIMQREPDAVYWPILTDSLDPMKQGSGNFAIFWDGGWYPQLRVQFFKGHLYGTPEPAQKPIALAGHFTFRAMCWYQITITWDDSRNWLGLYVNGVLVGTQNRHHKLTRANCGEQLLLGCPGMCMGEIRAISGCLDKAAVARLYVEAQTREYPEIDAEIQHTFSGNDSRPLDWRPGGGWRSLYANSLKGNSVLKDFYLQGMAEAVEETAEGICVRTRLQRSRPEKDTVGELGGIHEDKDQVYLWLLPVIDGDVAVEFEFMPMKENGLSMVILQAAGMHGEAFMEDWPRRTNGWMNTVYGENVRNYHWEYFREMDDCRNDVASHVLVKNPWLWPLHYQCQSKVLEQHTWHKLQFVQEGARLRGAINGQQVIDCIDTDTTGHGPIYRGGNIGIRCMWKSAFLFRNLKVWQRSRFEAVQ